MRVWCTQDRQTRAQTSDRDTRTRHNATRLDTHDACARARLGEEVTVDYQVELARRALKAKTKQTRQTDRPKADNRRTDRQTYDRLQDTHAFPCTSDLAFACQPANAHLPSQGKCCGDGHRSGRCWRSRALSRSRWLPGGCLCVKEK
jgi:hypothetical protein